MRCRSNSATASAAGVAKEPRPDAGVYRAPTPGPGADHAPTPDIGVDRAPTHGLGVGHAPAMDSGVDCSSSPLRDADRPPTSARGLDATTMGREEHVPRTSREHAPRTSAPVCGERAAETPAPVCGKLAAESPDRVRGEPARKTDDRFTKLSGTVRGEGAPNTSVPGGERAPTTSVPGGERAPTTPSPVCDEGEVNLDYLSSLPDDLLLLLLVRLPIEEAVRTSVLARRWRSVWTQLRTLVFHEDDGVQAGRFQVAVDSALDRHAEGALERLCIQMNWRPSINVAVIESWLRAAAARVSGTFIFQISTHHNPRTANLSIVLSIPCFRTAQQLGEPTVCHGQAAKPQLQRS